MISIRQSKNAKLGLIQMIEYMNQFVNTKDLVMVEIGCYVGDSTEIFADNFKKVIGIDPWMNGYDPNDAASYQHDMKIVEAQFDELCERKGNIIKIKKSSKNAERFFEAGDLDFVYIDGLHTYLGVKDDLKTWIPKVKSSGFVGGHDYQPRFQGVIDAVNEFKTPDKVFPDTSWIIKL